MKKNKNNMVDKDYYIGLDVGTSSVGFAVTDKEYNLKKHSGKSIWGVRLFDEGKTAEERRMIRTNRRRLERRNQRLELLKMLFDNEITKVDFGFFMRLKESFLNVEEKTNGIKYSLFADQNFTDKDYMKKYPTIYHLRKSIATSSEPFDVRLVYLAIRHILKNRGHFLFDIDSDNNSFEENFGAFLESLNEIKEISLNINSIDAYNIITKKASKVDRVKELVSLCNPTKDNKKVIEKLFSLIVGGTVKLCDICGGETIISNLSFDMGDDKLLEVADEIGDDFDLIYRAKAVYDSIILEKITKGYNSISEYKIAEYEQHKLDIKQLKIFIKHILKDNELYKEIFKAKKENLTNYSAYSGYKKSDKECHATQQDFCKYLKSKLPKEYEKNENYCQMYQRINESIFAPKLRKTENGVIPNSLHRSELIAILEKASSYLPFLNETDENKISVKEKIISIFDFKIPYYVGPLKDGWAVRKENGKIYPWNFEEKINLEESAEKFINQMTSICTYTGDDVLPKDSLLYSEFEVLNEINNIKINGEPISVECKKQIYTDLFQKNKKKVTKKSLESYLRLNGLFVNGDILSGIDDTVKSSLASYHKLKNIIEKTSYEQTEEIIKRIVLFGDDKKLLKKYFESETQLDKEDIKYLLRQKFTGWGRLSRKLLSGIEAVNTQTGELMTIIQMLRETNLNLMKILSQDYSFKEQADEYKAKKLGVKGTPREMVDALYVSPKIRRSIWQTLRILDEIVDVEKGAPKKIFIEVARENEGEDKKKSNSASRRSRKEQLIAWYKECKQNTGELFERLANETEEKLRSKKMYLYYLQFGKCMYSGQTIDLAELDNNSKYDIDHILPRSKIKDDSFDNLVLVKAELNREKTNVYPISEEIREKMAGFWAMLKDRGTISSKKYERLKRHTPLTQDELTAFINRQLVETRQSTKAIAELLKIIYPKTKVVYSKAGNVTDFRERYDLIKCRDVNDHHHAKDAYLNVVVGNFFDTHFTSEFIKNILTKEYSLNPKALYNMDVKGAWKSGNEGTIKNVRRTMAKNNVLFTIMPKEEHGQLFDLTIMKKGSGQVPIKTGLDIEKYGGYNKASGAYFAIVDHNEKGKKIRSIEAILKHQKNEYENNPEAFAKKYWYNDARIIVSKILFGSIFEFDGVRLSIRGRTGSRIIFSHTYQFVMNEDDLSYVKSIVKYVEKCKQAGGEIAPSSSSNLTIDKNVQMYDMLIQRIDNSIYKKLFSNMSTDIKKYRNKFMSMTLLEQSDILKEILKAFKCDATNPSFKSLCGKGVVGTILKPKKLLETSRTFLINQSVTGIFETKKPV